MKKLIIAIIGIALAVSILFAVTCFAQCVAEVKEAEIDVVLGSVRVMAQYTFNGQAVDVIGEPCDNCIYTSGRYDESQGTLEEIIALNESDRNKQCKYLIIKKLSQEHKNSILLEKLKEKKKQNEVLKEEFKKNIGNKATTSEVKEFYKNKEITVNASGSYSVVDLP